VNGATGWPGFAVTLAAGLIVTAAAPWAVDAYGVLQGTVYAIMALFALSQAFVWGFGGIMSFGQATFFGLGGYGFAIAALHYGGSTPALAIGIGAAALFALVLGYFIFYGRIGNVYVGVITMTVSIVFFNLANSSSGEAYAIAGVPIGGFNGIPSVPPLNLPGDADATLDVTQTWVAAMGALMLVYAALRGVLASRFGSVIVAIRENEDRARLLGYDARAYKLAAFVIGAVVAGLAGALFAAWNGYVNPGVFALTMSLQAIIYVLVGGIGTLVGPILGAVLIQMLVSHAGEQSLLDANLLRGLVLVVFVLLVPQGIVPVFRKLIARRAAPLRSLSSTGR
jgi:branched-chain amino acid transport system permease protein